MKVDRITMPLKDHRSQVIVDHGPGHCAPFREGIDVPTQQTLQALVEKEFEGVAWLWESVSTKQERRRRARPMRSSPNEAQSACACSPGKVERRKKASVFRTQFGPPAAVARPSRCNHVL